MAMTLPNEGVVYVEIDHFKQRVDILRTLRFMRVADACGNLGLSEPTYRRILERGSIREDELTTWCNAFNVSKRWWFESIAVIREYLDKERYPDWKTQIQIRKMPEARE